MNLDPYFYIPKGALLKGALEEIDSSTTKSYWVGKLTAGGKSTERVLVFESSGPLVDLVRIEVSALGNHQSLSSSPFASPMMSYRCMVCGRREALRTSPQGPVQTHRDDPLLPRDSNRD
jgi:hypothetical protein